ncbi:MULTISPECIES: alpha/beta-hydrolase N-terminal domain-containing protein [unclassified Streptomyces]|uniref:alpha/beta-hydrolase N-terminal domain-containing protein n=1 Tax=unclassified Streptomyces TaxID=2593676 RepID=UPI0034299391
MTPPPVPPPEEPAPRKHRWLPHLTLPGCWGALLLACLSFTPSLLPRGGVLQGPICGISAAIGYGLGVVAAYVWRAFRRPGGAQRAPRAYVPGPGTDPPSAAAPGCIDRHGP